MKDGMIKTGENFHLLYGRRQPLEKLPLRGNFDHPIRIGGEHQGRHGDSARVGEQARRGVVQIE
jgi:hypothetical protein